MRVWQAAFPQMPGPLLPSGWNGVLGVPEGSSPSCSFCERNAGSAFIGHEMSLYTLLCISSFRLQLYIPYIYHIYVYIHHIYICGNNVSNCTTITDKGPWHGFLKMQSFSYLEAVIPEWNERGQSREPQGMWAPSSAFPLDLSRKAASMLERTARDTDPKPTNYLTS